MGIVSKDGGIIKKEIVDYPNEIVSLEDIFNPINKFINENIDSEIESIGIAIPGISSDTFVNYTCNLPLRDIEIRDYIKTRLPIYVSNDANCAAIAEYQVADGKLFSNYALVTFGTGIGAGLIIKLDNDDLLYINAVNMQTFGQGRTLFHTLEIAAWKDVQIGDETVTALQYYDEKGYKFVRCLDQYGNFYKPEKKIKFELKDEDNLIV